jgi:hypothetical protein
VPVNVFAFAFVSAQGMARRERVLDADFEHSPLNEEVRSQKLARS